MRPIIEIKNLKKNFSDGSNITYAINNINLSIEPGEFISIVGPSGCGKTTVLKCIAGLLPVTEGQILINGKITLVFQEYNKSLFYWKTVRENIVFSLTSIERKEKNEIAEKYLNLIDLAQFADYYPFELSGGMQQRVAIARALAFNPDIIMMDEPLSSLDAITRKQLADKILLIWSELKKTIIYVTHDIEEALCLSDRIIVLSRRPSNIMLEKNILSARPRLLNSPNDLIKIKNEIQHYFNDFN